MVGGGREARHVRYCSADRGLSGVSLGTLKTGIVGARELETKSQKPVRLAGEGPPVDGRSTMRIRAFILLAGSVRKTGLLAAIGRSVLDLPLTAEKSLGRHWLEKAGALAESLEQESLDFRVVVDGASSLPDIPIGEQGRLRVALEEDPLEFRGTAGVLRDLTREYDPKDFILVANASQPPMEDLAPSFRRLAEAKGVARVLIDERRSPTGLMLLRADCLEGVSEVGYEDLKEQALPAIAKDGWVSAVESAGCCLDPIRSRATYLDAVRACHVGTEVLDDPFREEWRSTFSLVEEGAEVAETARIHDSVILSGGVVGENAVVARSVIGPGKWVRAGEVRVDETVAKGGD